MHRPIPTDVVACGEVGLGGELRQVGQTARRLAEAARLGFRRAIVPQSSPAPPSGIELVARGDAARCDEGGRRSRRDTPAATRPTATMPPWPRRTGEAPSFSPPSEQSSPGTPLREGLDRILQANMGALIVVGDGPEVLNICSGGFLLDAAFSPQRLSELAKMDGAIILASDASRIARANVHLVPNPNVPTSETGTRHRTAERVARSIAVPVISVSEDMSVIAVYSGDQKHPLESIPRSAHALEPGAADAGALQEPARRGVGVAVGARGRGPRDRARRRLGAAANRDGAAHRR